LWPANSLELTYRCIFLELFVKKPIFQGNDDIHQLEVIWKVMGTPTIEQWPAFSEQPWYELVKPREILPSLFRKSFIE
jgi:CTD kinase subunit alpha